MAEPSPSDTFTFNIKWNGKDVAAAVEPTETVAGLKRVLEIQTNVLAKKQKLLGLKTLAGKPATDDTPITELSIKPNQKVMLMGTAETKLEALAAQELIEPHIQVHDDFAEETEDAEPLELASRPEIQEKLQRRIKAALIKEMNPSGPGKKAAVFDIDYTIFALDSKSENPLDLARPFLHEFFTAIYPHYDIIIWSATSMKWIEMKLKELRVSNHPDFKITLCMDYTSMVTVAGAAAGHGRTVFDCKPLQVLWERYPQYTSSNTVMFDDLKRNYVLNKQNGLVIKPFRRALTSGKADRELLKLKAYLLKIAELETLEELDHSRWEKFARKEIAVVEAAQAIKEQNSSHIGGTGTGGGTDRSPATE
ncbi:putative Ubiquitin-like domain-containing CTD phosphatase [Nannochloris sp. 'desiccata']|nr:putative Ubiquitin-like domain-containing CTD phosphatase [Chlorella desiccata (nom. nud.)]